MDVPKRGKGGRRPKGDRVRTTVALPSEVVLLAQQMADRDGVPVTDVIGRLCAEALGIPVPDYCLPKPKQNQEALPLAEAS